MAWWSAASCRGCARCVSGSARVAAQGFVAILALLRLLWSVGIHRGGEGGVRVGAAAGGQVVTFERVDAMVLMACRSKKEKRGFEVHISARTVRLGRYIAQEGIMGHLYTVRVHVFS